MNTYRARPRRSSSRIRRAVAAAACAVSGLATSLVAVSAEPAHAVVVAGFTAGDVVVYAVGNSGASGSSQAVSLDEYSPSGTLVQQVALPTSASGSNKPLTASNSATSEGLLTLSPNSQYLVATGYDTGTGTAGVGSSTSASIPRTVAVVNASAAVNTTTALTDAANGNNVRSATTDNGTNLWVTGAAGGIRYTTVGSTTSTEIVTDSAYKNQRQVSNYNGQLYTSADPTKNTAVTVATVGTGLPTSGAQAVTNLPWSSAPSEPYAYSFVTLGSGSAPDTVYVADNSAGAVLKYGLSGGTWVKDGSVSVPNVIGVTADDTNGVVSIFATAVPTAGTSGTLYSITDSSGQNGTLTGTANSIASSPSSQGFRGVAFTPGTVFGSGGPPPPVLPTIGVAHSGLPAAIGDPTNPTDSITVGDTNYSDPSVLNVTATSSNSAVAPQSGITISGTGATRTLSVTPGSSVGYSTITLTVTAPDTRTASTAVTYGLSANLGDSSDRYFSGAGNLSTAIDVGGGYVIGGDDESNILRLYNETQSGPPVKAFDFTSQLPRGTTEIDIEASARAGNTLYWTGSMSNSSGGDVEPARSTLFAATISGSGANTNLTYVGSYTGLQTDLVNWDKNDGHGMGANYLGLDNDVNGGTANHAINALELEGMEFAPGSSSTAYLAFRGPIELPNNPQDALVVPLTNINQLVTGAATQATFGTPMFWSLGGLGVRELRANADGTYLLIAGTADGSNSSFVLYTWDGNPSDQPQQTNTSLPLIPSGANQGSWESIVSVPDPLTSGSTLQLIEDNGDTAWYGDSETSKTGLATDLQKDLSRDFTYAPPANDVVITADNKTRTYGQADPTFTFTVSGLSGGDTLTTQPTCGVSGDDSAVGTYPITCSGAVTSQSSDSISYVAGTLSVTKAPVTVGVGADANPAVTGQSVTFTATVAPSGTSSGVTPTGSVEFQSDGSDLPGCGSASLTSGSATCVVSSGFSAGSHSVVAFYSGDASYQAGDNSTNALHETVNMAGTTTTIGSSANPSTSGHQVSFTATIAVVAPGMTSAAALSGSVEFQADGTDIAGCSSVPVDPTGSAVCSDPSGLSTGSHTVSATYSGDSNFITSSDSLNQVASAAETYLFVNENPNGPNEVRNYLVNPDGSTTLIGSYPTGHPGEAASWVAAERAAVAQTTNHLYALNLGDQTVSVFSIDPSTGELTLESTTPPLDATTIAVNPAGTVLYAGGYTNFGTGGELSSYAIAPDGSIDATPIATVPGAVDGLAVSPDGTEIAAAYPGLSIDEAHVSLWSTDSAGDLSLTDTMDEPGPTDARFASNGTLYSASAWYDDVTSYSVEAGQLSQTGVTQGTSQVLAVASDGSVYFDTAGGLQGATVTGGSFADGPTTSFPSSDLITSMAVNPDGSSLFVASFNESSVNNYSIGSDGALTLQEQISVPAGLPSIVAYTPILLGGQSDQRHSLPVGKIVRSPVRPSRDGSARYPSKVGAAHPRRGPRRSATRHVAEGRRYGRRR